MKHYLAISLFLLSANASAVFNCVVDIDRVLVYGEGVINVKHSGRNNFTHICNLNTVWKGVSVSTCAMWTSMLQSLKNNNEQAIFYYRGEGSCENLPTYGGSPAPVYIGSVEN